MEASTRRKMYLASIARPTSPGCRLLSLLSLAVRNEQVLDEIPAPVLPDERPPLPVLDSLVETEDAVRKDEERGRHVFGEDLLHLEVELLALGLVVCSHRVIENFVQVRVHVMACVEAARDGIA